MKRALIALTVAASIVASGASAYDSKTLEILENLSEATIEGIILGEAEGTLSERNERRERLRSAQEDWKNHPKASIDLSFADLYRASLRNIDLHGADLRGADLKGANLHGAILTSANLSDADLSGANLGGAELYYADLRGAILRGANLYGADLSGVMLNDADLRGAMMRGAILCNTTMPDGSVIYSGC